MTDIYSSYFSLTRRCLLLWFVLVFQTGQSTQYCMVILLTIKLQHEFQLAWKLL